MASRSSDCSDRPAVFKLSLWHVTQYLPMRPRSSGAGGAGDCVLGAAPAPRKIATIDQKKAVRTVFEVIIGPADRAAAADEIDYNSRGPPERAGDKRRGI